MLIILCIGTKYMRNIGFGYCISENEILSISDGITCYRGIRSIDNKSVIIKIADVRLPKSVNALRAEKQKYRANSYLLPILANHQLADNNYCIVYELPKPLYLFASQKKGIDDDFTIYNLLQLSIKLATALTCLHSSNIILDTLCPQNIWISDDQVYFTQTSLHSIMPFYQSPEQFLGEVITPASNIFSIGEILYEWSTGYMPFNGINTLKYFVTSTDPIIPVNLNAKISNTCSDIIIKLLAKRPEQRSPLSYLCNNADDIWADITIGVEHHTLTQVTCNYSDKLNFPLIQLNHLLPDYPILIILT